MRTTLFCDVQGQHSWQTQVPRKLQHTLRAHPRQSPYPIMKGILFGLLVKVARGVFLSGVLKQLYRKNTPTIYTLSVWRSGSVNGVYTFIPLIYCLLGGYMLPTDPTYKPGTRNNHCHRAVFWWPQKYQVPCDAGVRFPKMPVGCREAPWLVGLGHYYTT